MKAKITSLLLTTLLISGCSTGFFVSSGYDDIYYSPEDEPIVVVTRKTPVASDNYYKAIDNYETEGILLESEIPVYDTIQGEYFEKGDEGVVVNNYYSGGVYDSYDYNYSRRIRLFHSPYMGAGYYSSFYDPFYWDYDPFYWGSGFYMDSWSRYRMYGRMRLSPFRYSWMYPYDYYSPYFSWYSPYNYGGYGSYYGGYGSYYGSYGYSQRPVRSNDVYYGHRRAGASNRAIASSSSPIKRSTAGRSDINSRRTSANNSAVSGTRRSTDSRSTVSTYTNNRRTSTDVSRSATSRKVSTTRITPRQSNTSSRRSSGSTATSRSSTSTQRYYPSYNKTRTVSKPTYNRSSRTYQSRSSSSSSRSVYSRPSSSSSRSSSSYSAPTRSSRSSYSGSSSRSSGSGYRSSGSSRSSSSGSRSSSSSSGRSSSSSSGRRR